jgi:hypothetical protein
MQRIQKKDMQFEFYHWGSRRWSFHPVKGCALHPHALLNSKLVIRALHKYMHEVHADRDHAMCDIQNRTILVVQLTQFPKKTQLRTCPLRTFRELVFLKAHSNAKCLVRSGNTGKGGAWLKE